MSFADCCSSDQCHSMYTGSKWCKRAGYPGQMWKLLPENVVSAMTERWKTINTEAVPRNLQSFRSSFYVLLQLEISIFYICAKFFIWSVPVWLETDHMAGCEQAKHPSSINQMCIACPNFPFQSFWAPGLVWEKWVNSPPSCTAVKKQGLQIQDDFHPVFSFLFQTVDLWESWRDKTESSKRLQTPFF